MRRTGLVFLLLLALPGPIRVVEGAAARQVFLRLIVVAEQDAAVRIWERLEAGEPFADLARAESIDASAVRGGFLGELGVSRMNDQIRNVIRSLAPGEFTEPFPLGARTALIYREKAGFRNQAYQLQRRGLELADEGKHQQAIELYRQALDVYPDFIHGYFLMALAYQKLGDRTREIEYYRKALVVEPGYYQAHYNLGLALLAEQDPAGAVRALAQGVDSKPDYTDCWVSLSAAHLALGHVDAAIQAARKATEANPVRATGYYNLGAALSRRDPRRALDAFETASRLQPLKPDYRMAVAMTNGQLGNVQTAVSLLREIVRDHPDFEPARQVLLQLGRGSQQED